MLLDVRAIGINFPDLLATQGHYQHKPELPFVPGCEIAGVIRAAPPGSGWRPGERAAAFVWQGGYAEVASVPSHALMAVPEAMDLGAAAAMVVNYQTVLFALDRRGRLEAGEVVLVLGAGGGIGTAALQVARGLEAGKTIGGVANEDQVATARAAGADEVIVIKEGFAAQLKEMTGGRGVDLILDPLGDWIFDEALRALAPEGRILIIGFAAGDIPSVKLNRLLLRNAAAVGVLWGSFIELEPTLVRSAGERLAAMVERGAVRPQIGARYSFEEIPDALERLQAGQIRGKAIAELGAD